MTALLTDNLPLLAGAPNGIKKLRELILELAVRGKLVPQDPTDEPASELLKRIAEQKARLVAEGKIKALKLIEELPNVNSLANLPSSWSWVRFGEIAQHNSGKTLDKGRNTGISRDYITTSNLYWGRFELDNVKQMLIREDELDKCTATKNDLLICEGGEAGRAAVWEQDKEICFQNHVHRARLYGEVSPHYAQRFFEKINASGEINQYRKGIGISNMSSKALASITFPLPPLAEQHRIAAKVDELMALCDRLEAQQADADSAHAQLVQALLDSLTQASDATEFAANWQRLAEHFHTLFTTESSIDALKQTLLQLAVMGKLVPQDPSDEPASKLLQRIAEEKTRLVAEGKIKKQKALAEVSEEERPFEPPQAWMWCRLQEAFDVRDGTHDTPKYQHSGYPLVTSKNLYTGKLDLDDVKFISEEDHEKISARSKVDRGDILFAMIGSIGNPAIVDTDIPFSIKNVALIKQYSPALMSEHYLLLFLLVAAADMREKSAGGVQSFVSLGSIRLYPFVFPPLAEQHRIVAKVDQLMALCDQLKTRLTQARQLNEQLASTLVEQAVA